MAKFRDFSRLRTVGGTTLVGCSGDMADLQQLTTMLADLDTSNEEWADGHAIRPKAIHSFLTRVFYNKCACARLRCGMRWPRGSRVAAGVEGLPRPSVTHARV